MQISSQQNGKGIRVSTDADVLRSESNKQKEEFVAHTTIPMPAKDQVVLWSGGIVTASILSTLLCYFVGRWLKRRVENERNALLDLAKNEGKRSLTGDEQKQLEKYSLFTYGLILLSTHWITVGAALTATLIVMLAGVLRLALPFLGYPISEWANEANSGLLKEFCGSGIREYLFAILGVAGGVIATLVVEKTSAARSANIEGTVTELNGTVKVLTDASNGIDNQVTRLREHLKTSSETIEGTVQALGDTSKDIQNQVAELQNHFQTSSQAIGGTVSSLDSTSQAIRNQVLELQQVLGVQPVRSLGKLMDEIEGVFNLASSAPSGKLWIMNPTAAYGYFNCFDLDAILGFGQGLPVRSPSDRVARLSALTHGELNLYQARLLQRHETLRSAMMLAMASIRDYSKISNSDVVADDIGLRKIVYATLSATASEQTKIAPSLLVDEFRAALDSFKGASIKRALINEALDTTFEEVLRVIARGASYYQREFVRPALTGRESEESDDHEHVAVVDRDRVWQRRSEWAALLAKKRVFVVPITEAEQNARRKAPENFHLDDSKWCFEWLMKHLNEVQASRIENMNSVVPDAPNLVVELHNIPIQLFMFTSDDSSEKGRCLVVFSNRYTLSTSSDLAAFLITEKSTIDTFRLMFAAITNQERIASDQ